MRFPLWGAGFPSPGFHQAIPRQNRGFSRDLLSKSAAKLILSKAAPKELKTAIVRQNQSHRFP